MAVPQRRKSKAKTRSRRAPKDTIRLAHVAICHNCGADVQPHRACPSCGWYKDRVAVDVAEEFFDEEEAEV